MKTFFLAGALFFYVSSVAQESEQNLEDISPAIEYAWYESPWMWVGAAAMVIILLVMSSKNKKSK